jgi:hypothetical protein
VGMSANNLQTGISNVLLPILSLQSAARSLRLESLSAGVEHMSRQARVPCKGVSRGCSNT